MEKFTDLRVVLLPDEKLQQDAISLAETLTRDNQLFHIDGVKYLPHLTVYMASYPEKNIKAVYETIRNISQQLSNASLDYGTFYTGWGYVGIGFKREAKLLSINEAIVKSLSPLREGHLREKYTSEIAANKFTPRQLEYIKTFGNEYVFDEYEPHLSLCRYSNVEGAKKITSDLNKSSAFSSGTVTKIAIAESGPNGTCTSILEEFPLKDE